MSDKKTRETLVEKYSKLSREIKHQKKVLETARRNVEKTSKALDEIVKKFWFCPNCNKPVLLPHKKDCRMAILSLEGKFYNCKFTICPYCEKEVLIEKEFLNEDD